MASWSRFESDSKKGEDGKYVPNEADAALTAERLKTELQDLWNYVYKERQIRDAEISAQADDFSAYWGNLLVCSATIRPSLWLLILSGVQIGGLVAAYHKSNYKRPRPAQAWLPIAPSIATPGHPAYPSGHATQAHLISLFMQLVAPELSEACDALARRIAGNREIAGVHYRSDTLAGEWSARKIFDLLCGHSPVTIDQDTVVSGLVAAFNDLVAAARSEWRPDFVRPQVIETDFDAALKVANHIDGDVFKDPPRTLANK